MAKQYHCSYDAPTGESCQQPVGLPGLCFWHDPDMDKSQQNLKEPLEEFARSGGLMKGLKLKGANLTDVDLVRRDHKDGYDLSYSDLYRANLQGAHLFNMRLNAGSLMKADLTNANLHCCNFEDSNLLGAKWHGSMIEGITVGDSLMQEKSGRQARMTNDIPLANDHFLQSEEIYRNLRKASEMQGLFEMGGRFIHKELVMHRFQMPPWSTRRATSKAIDLFCGYGEKPLNVVNFSLIIILVSAIGYFFLGVASTNGAIIFSTAQTTSQNTEAFFNVIYYSVVTFTTLGYGDITPVGLSRAIAAIEAFIGSFTLALFVVVFVKKMTR